MSDYLPNTKRLNICVLGEIGAGKSSLIIKYAQSHFPEDHDPTLQETYTLSVKFDYKDETVNGANNNYNQSNDYKINDNENNIYNHSNVHNTSNNNNNDIHEHSISAIQMADEDSYRLDILDTVGIEDYSELRENQIQEADAIIFCYDVTCKLSYDIVTVLHQQVLRCREDFLPPMVLCGTKSDLIDNRQLSYEDGVILAKELNLDSFIETSAKLNVNVEESFVKTAKLIIDSKNSQIPIALDQENDNSNNLESINNINNNPTVNQQDTGYMTASNSVNNILEQSILTKHSSSQTRAMQSSEPNQIQERGILPSSDKTDNNNKNNNSNNSRCCIIM